MRDLELKHQMIITDALGIGMVGDVVSSVHAKLRGVANIIGDWSNNRIRPDAKIPLVAYNSVIKDLAGARFSDISQVKITTPRGLKGGLADYSESLFDALLKVENIENEVLKPFSIWLSLRIASPDTLASAAGVTDLKHFKEQDIEGTRAALSKFVDPTGRVDSLPLQAVYPNLSAIKPTWDNANSLATRYLETNPSKIVKQVREISEKVGRVIDIIEKGTDESTPKLSAQTATILSGICLNMSQAVDLYGQMGILIRELVVACDHQVGELKKPLAESRKMATESFVQTSEQHFTFGGVKIPYSFVKDKLNWPDHEVVPLSDLDWVFEHLQRDPLVGTDDTDEYSYSKDAVGAVRIGEHLYPITNLNLLAAAQGSDSDTIACSILTVEALVLAFTQDDDSKIYNWQ
jgi:hypothetical protein